MAMFDTITCYFPLPDGFEYPYGWQTYDLGGGMGEFTIDKEGQLFFSGPGAVDCVLIRALTGKEPHEVEIPPQPVNHSGTVSIYGCNLARQIPGFAGIDSFIATHDDKPYWQRTYKIRFKKGKVVKITGGESNKTESNRVQVLLKDAEVISAASMKQRRKQRKK